MPWQSEIAVKLSQLIVDADKDWGRRNIVNFGTGGVDLYSLLTAHAARHLKGGADEVLNLANINNAVGFDISAHGSRHEKGGADEIKVLGSVTLDDATLASLAADPMLAKGRVWFRGDLGQIRWSPDGVTVKTLLNEEDPINVAYVAGTPLTGRDWSADFAKLQNLDIALTTLATLKRWGRDVSPAWVAGSEVTAPDAGTALVSRTVSTGKTGYVYGFLITAGEANDFRLVWTSGGTARSLRVAFASRGTVILVSPVPVNEGLPADGGTSVAIQNVNAGSSGVVYQAAILYAEV
jgi:hypothetical protein